MTEELLKVENTPTHHRRKHNVSGTTQASFLAKFKATNLARKDTRQSVPKTLWALRYIIKYR